MANESKYKDFFAFLGVAFAFSALGLGLVGLGYWLGKRQKSAALGGLSGAALPSQILPPRRAEPIMPTIMPLFAPMKESAMQPSRVDTHKFTVSANAVKILGNLGASARTRDVRVSSDQPVYISSSSGEAQRGLLLAPGTIHIWGEIGPDEELWAVSSSSNDARLSVMVRFV